MLLYGSHSKDGTGDFILLSFEEYVPILRFDLGSGLTTLRYATCTSTKYDHNIQRII